MMTVSASQQPTIAIITANYCEKLAVDAMMENKTTYVKFKTGGECHFSLNILRSQNLLDEGSFQQKNVQHAKVVLIYLNREVDCS